MRVGRDHAGGNELFSNKYPGLNIFGPAEEEVPAVTHKVKGGDAFQLGGFNVEVYDAGCHTRVRSPTLLCLLG